MSPVSFSIGQRIIGPESAPFIIAEMSGNHNQSLERALKIVDAAADTGAHALKIQTYRPDTMTLDVNDKDFRIDDQASLWSGKNLYQLYGEACTPYEWHKPIFDRCKERGMIGFSTPFDPSAVDFLETLQVPVYKVASFECTDLPLIKKIARTGKPMIISTGMASVGEIDEAVRTARAEGNDKIVILKCTSTYPALPTNSNILTIPHMRNLFGVQVGLSDHTMGIGVAVGAAALGATVVEKHFTLRRADGGVDSAFSMEPEEFKSLVIETERVWQSLGNIRYGATEVEKKSLQFRRSLYISADMKSGEVLSVENVKIVRPGFGLAPKFYDLMIGKRVNRDVKKGTPLTWELIG